ncbi:integrase [Rhodoferax sp. GW822-FHT02A01]|uniref:integrase n=1 Tax=Rhodoferax sp. GW822-FHT02A01 TaxID=3141537 RepID=UPI00315C84AD
MKKSKYPRLRSHTRKGKGGQVWVSYWYDMRGTGKPDVPLGNDYATAIQQWDRLVNHLPMTKGRVQEAIDKFKERVLPTYTSAETVKGYTKNLRQLEPVFGKAGWHEITLPVLRQYLDGRSAKTQGNRELALLSVIWGKALLWGMTEKTWPAAGVKGWKNPEQPREFEVTTELFNAVYEHADQVLRDCMDIATTTGMRLTDTRTVRMPVDGRLRFRAGKTGKWDFFVVEKSPVLTALLERRGNAESVMLLTTKTGRAVSESMLRTRYDAARIKASAAYPKLADDIKAMFLRDTRKRAADLAEDVDEASKLLQHSSKSLTVKHYRTKGNELKAVR